MTPTGINWLDYVVIPAAAVVALGVLLKFAVAVTRLWRRVNHFLDDFFGEPERPGRPAQPGMMARVASLEEADSELGEKVDTLCDDMRREVREERERAFESHVYRFHTNPEGNMP